MTSKIKDIDPILPAWRVDAMRAELVRVYGGCLGAKSR
jgi:hypothetical protein